MSQRRLIELGYVIEPHGMRGELKVELYNSESTAFAPGLPLFAAKSAEQIKPDDAPDKVETIKAQSFGVVVKLAGVSNRTAAEALKGFKLFVERESLPPLAEGEYYLCDLIGFAANRADGSPLGVVEEFTHNGAQTLFVVRAPSGLRFLVPNAPQIIIEVNLQTRVVTMNPPEGLFEDESLAF